MLASGKKDPPHISFGENAAPNEVIKGKIIKCLTWVFGPLFFDELDSLDLSDEASKVPGMEDIHFLT